LDVGYLLVFHLQKLFSSSFKLLKEMLFAFIFSSLCIVVVSLTTAKPSKEIEADFEAVRAGNVNEN